MELEKVGEKTYYIKNPTNIGIYKINDKDVYIIDTGNDKEAGRKILKIINEQGWEVKGVINTHSHADHIGGNKIIQDRTNCNIYTHGAERAFTENTILESTVLFGGYPFKEIRNKFLFAKESRTIEIEGNLPEGLEYFSIKGHSPDMIGIKTSDDVYFLGDSLVSKETISKYHVFVIYDIKECLNTLEYLKTLKKGIYIPAHCEKTTDITELIQINQNKILEISDKLFNICKEPITFEGILKRIFEEYNLCMNANQYVLIGGTIRSYLSYLNEENRLEYEFKDNEMLWKQTNI